MTQVIGKGHHIQARRRTLALLSKPDVDGQIIVNSKREQFLAILKDKFGYTNEKAVDELERLLKQFYTTNKSLGIRRSRLKNNQFHTG